jgi:glycosyltransferase involved in cell wall biosynthesis
MRSPFVSVIIPAYNYGKFIRDAIQSVLRQTYPLGKIEIIVIDDGSTDNTYKLINDYSARIRYVRQEHKGIASARNNGVRCAKGDIITFLDADDAWFGERIETVVNQFKEHPETGFVYHDVAVMDENGFIVRDSFNRFFGYRMDVNGWLSTEIFSGKVFCGGSSFSFRKDIVDNICPIPEDIKRGIDYYFAALASCMAHGKSIPVILGKYRLHGNNKSFFAGHRNVAELASVNYDFACMRGKVIERLSCPDTSSGRKPELDIIRRIRAKEKMFYHVLSFQRFKGITYIPDLFKGVQDYSEIMRGSVLALMTLMVPAHFYPILIKTLSKRGELYPEFKE